MSTISEYLTHQHRECDDLLAKAEDAVHSGNGDAQALTQAFVNDLTNHLEREEMVMFPAFERASGMMGGPTNMMRQEHMQMRALAKSMTESVDDKKRFFGLSETLMILIQQHNMKEEQMLYKMADQHLAAEAGTVIENMENLV